MQLSIKDIFLSRPYFLTKILILCVEKHAADPLSNFRILLANALKFSSCDNVFCKNAVRQQPVKTFASLGFDPSYCVQEDRRKR